MFEACIDPQTLISLLWQNKDRIRKLALDIVCFTAACVDSISLEWFRLPVAWCRHLQSLWLSRTASVYLVALLLSLSKYISLQLQNILQLASRKTKKPADSMAVVWLQPRSFCQEWKHQVIIIIVKCSFSNSTVKWILLSESPHWGLYKSSYCYFLWWFSWTLF